MMMIIVVIVIIRIIIAILKVCCFAEGIKAFSRPVLRSLSPSHLAPICATRTRGPALLEQRPAKCPGILEVLGLGFRGLRLRV